MSDAAITIREVDRSAPAPSPFLPDTKIQYAWDSTSLGYLKTCPRLYQYIMIDGWAEADQSIHLWFGMEFHSALEEYDHFRIEGADHEEGIRKAVQELLVRIHGCEVDETVKAGKYKNPHNLVQLVIDYLDKYRDDAATTFILQDGRPAVELSFRFELDWGPKASEESEAICRAREQGNFDEVSHIAQPYLLSGHLDRVVDFQGNLFVMDRKTTTTTPGPYYFNQFEPNNQMTLYTLASQVVLASPIKGVIIDAAQILLEKPNNFQRGFTYRTPDQLEEWTRDLRYWLTLAEQYATIGYWPMNDTACDKFGGCRFREICSKSPQVRERFLASEFKKLPEEERWNPLKPR